MVQFDWKGDRLKDFLKKREISVQTAAAMLGVSRQTVYQYFASEQLTREVVTKILLTFGAAENEIFEAKFIAEMPLQNGGDYPSARLGAGNGNFQNRFIDLHNGNIMLVTPLVEVYARNELINNFDKMTDFLTSLPNHPVIIDKFQKGNFLSFRVSGDSMNDGTSQSILNGSVVVGREVDLENLKGRFSIEKNQDYVIVHKEGVLVKRIASYDHETGVINCKALNPDKDAYPDPVLQLSDCLMVFLIVNVSTSRAK